MPLIAHNKQLFAKLVKKRLFSKFFKLIKILSAFPIRFFILCFWSGGVDSCQKSIIIKCCSIIR